MCTYLHKILKIGLTAGNWTHNSFGYRWPHYSFVFRFSLKIRLRLARRLVGRSINPDWQWTVQRIQRIRPLEMDTILAKLLLQATIYHVWQERNARRHQQTRVPTDHLRRIIDKAVRNRITSLKYKHAHKYGGLLQRWFLNTS